MKRPTFCTALVLGVGVTTAHASTLVDLQFDTSQASFSSQHQYENNGNRRGYQINEDGKTYQAFLEGNNSLGNVYNRIRNPWLSPGNAFRGNRALGMQIKESPNNAWEKQRIEYSISHTGFNQMEWGRKYAYGFNFKIGADSGIPIANGRPIIHQLWQGGPASPPLAFYLYPKANRTDVVEMLVQARNNSTKTHFGDTTGADPYELARFDVSIGDYHELNMFFIPSYNGDGQAGTFRMRFDGQLVIDRDRDDSNGVDIGYAPGSILGSDELGYGVMKDHFVNKVGIYRFGPQRNLTMYYDDIYLVDQGQAFSVFSTATIPEPASLTVYGGLGLAMLARRRRWNAPSNLIQF